MAAAIGTGFVANEAAKVVECLGKLAFEKIAPYFGGENKLKGVKDTMEMIQARLADAERQGEGDSGEAVKLWLRRLKRVLYRLEDLLEEIEITEADNEAEIMEQTPPSSLGKMLNSTLATVEKISRPLTINKLVADEAAAIMEELEVIQSDMATLNLSCMCPSEKPLRVQYHESISRETHSFIFEEEVVGRDSDKKAILDLVLSSNYDVAGENVCVIPIVGIGGWGKTTLAQLVFNDEQVQKHFKLSIWSCISEISSLGELLEKIVRSISGESCHQLGVQVLQTRLQGFIKNNKCLLVLDDLWDENRENWLQLKRLLRGCKQGSRIIVTTRSMVVAQNMGTRTTYPYYELGVLPEDKSWDLFRILAFKEGQEEGNPNLTSIGKQIVKKCGNLPLAIRTIAGLLYSKDTQQEWEHFKDKELRMIDSERNIIMSTLKLSYDYLPSHVKQCFAYCSLFPKDYEFNKQYLIELWMAQGFLGLSNGRQTLENVGHGYFMELLRRSFFQEVRTSRYGNTILSCKMHDLVHDLALDVSRGEIQLIHGPTQHINDDTLHLSFLGDLSWNVPSSLLVGKKLLRSFISVQTSSTMAMHEAIPNLRHVRALDLARVSNSLPNSIVELKHLRYLRLDFLKSLPEGITRLRYLQTLDLGQCWALRELPTSLSNLNSLMHLYFPQDQLIDLPPRFRFVNWRGDLASETETGILKESNITELRTKGEKESRTSSEADQDEKEGTYLERLQPPPSMRKLTVKRWKGTKFPSWGINDGLGCHLPNSN